MSKKLSSLVLIICIFAGVTINFSNASSQITQEEIDWVLENYPVIRVVPDLFYAPIEYLEGDEVIGLSMDYLNWIETNYGLNFEIVKVPTWSEALEVVKSNHAHMHSAVAVTPERLQYLFFSRPYVDAPRVLLRQKGSNVIDNEIEFLTLNIGVVSGYAVESFIRMRYPTLELQSFETIEKALLAVSFGEVDALATELFQATYYADRLKITNLTAFNRYEVDYPIQLSFAFNKSHEKLAYIFDKMLGSIPEDHVRQLENKWFTEFYERVLPTEILFGIGIIVTLILVITFSVIVWNRMLKKKVLEKTLAIHQQSEELYERNIELSEQYMEIQALYEEMAAAEETLKENYEELSDYKNQLEYRAFHRVETELYNKAYLSKILKSYVANENNHVLLFFGYGDESLGNLFYNVKNRMHMFLAEILNTFSKHSQHFWSFDLSENRLCVLIEESEDSEKLLNDLIDKIVLASESVTINDSLTVKIKLFCGAIRGLDYLSDEYCEVALTYAKELQGIEQIVWFAPWMHEAVLKRQQLAIDLPNASEKNEFLVYFQPQYDSDRSIIGAEALIRWNHPIYGMVSPMDFIELAESISLIGVVGEHVLKKVAQVQKTLQKEYGVFIPIAINVSIVELLDRDFIGKVDKILKESDVAPSFFAFEITETAFSAHVDSIQESIHHLINRGHQIYLDDFGTGYSSFSYLSQFKIQAAKIDRMFVKRHEENGALLPAMILFFRKINLSSVVEGVETEDQLSTLLAMNCEKFQGFFFSKPLPEEEFFKVFDA